MCLPNLNKCSPDDDNEKITPQMIDRTRWAFKKYKPLVYVKKKQENKDNTRAWKTNEG